MKQTPGAALDSGPARRATVLLLAVGLLLASVALHTVHFHDRDFREDEIYTVHAAQIMNLSEVVQWLGLGGVHPPGWRLAAVIWVQMLGEAGKTEPIVRYFSTLVTLIALALLWRLGADLFGWPTGAYAVFLLGTLPFAQFFMHEFRPYGALVLVTVGCTLALVRWVRRPTFARALLFVAFGVAALQTHYYGGFLLAGLAVAFVLLVRWQRDLYLRAFGLFFAIGLSLTAWLLPLAHRFIVGAGGVTYALPSDRRFFQQLYDEMMPSPPAMGDLLVLVGALTLTGLVAARLKGLHALLPSRFRWDPAFVSARAAPQGVPVPGAGEERYRFGPAGQRLIVLVAPTAMLALAFVINRFGTGNATPKNLIILVPFLALTAALGVRQLPWQARLAAILLITYPALTTFRTYRSNAPYRELVDFMEPAYQPGDKVIAHVQDYASSTQVLYYYLHDRLPGVLDKADMFHIGGSSHRFPHDPIANQVYTADEQTLARFAQFLDEAPRAWLITYHRADLLDPFLAVLHQDYADAQKAVLVDDRNVYEIVAYYRVPETLTPLARFGDAISLQGWNLPGGVSVRACQDMPFESWWYALDAPAADLGIGLVLADANGQGVVKADAEPGGYRTLEWAAGTYHLDKRTLRVPCDLPPGDYPLLVGMYDVTTGDAAPAFTPDGAPLPSSLVYLTTVTVSEGER
ncbi:MAG: hypothetical protein Kow00106_13380 [Anaerolineae bacterium]